MRFQSATVTDRLRTANPGVLTAWSVVAAFTTYFCMYAFRKPYTVAQYEGLELWGMGYKVVLLFSQVGGYAVSKFIGIKVISEMTAGRRAGTILLLIASAHAALLPYAVAPYWLKPVFLFFNGLPLGMVYGCVFAFLEGRRVTEAMAAGLCASFIMASGTVKSAGAMLMEYQGVSQFWMPFATGAIFWLPLVVGIWMLHQIPPPSDIDVEERSARPPIDRADRRQFFSRYRLGIGVLVLMFVALTVFRSVRDDYAAEIWRGFGVETPEIFVQSETIVAAATLVLSALAVFIRSNVRAFVASMAVVAGAYTCAMATTFAYWGTTSWTEQSAFRFMVLLGISLYFPYVLFHTTIYERLLATLRDKSNVGFLIYVGDFAGYMSTIALMALLSLSSTERIDFVSLLFWLAATISPLSIVGAAVSVIYFAKCRRDAAPHVIEPPITDPNPQLEAPVGGT